MKKIYAFFSAILLSLSAFASMEQVPSDADLSSYYSTGEVCVCIFVPTDLACNDIVLTGSFNDWSSTISECPTFEPVEGYDGWYVTSFEPGTEPSAEYGSVVAKPIMLDVNGNFNWDYQIGAATPIRGGVQVVQISSINEIQLINYSSNVPNVYSVDAWKENPCTATYHNYTITVINDGCGGYVVPFIVGGMNSWTFQEMQLDENMTQEYAAPVYTISFTATENTPYQLLSGLMNDLGEIIAEPFWSDEAYMQEFKDGQWDRIKGGDNSLLGEETNIVYDLRAGNLRWTRCILPGGSCGENLIWSVDPYTGILVISGSGAMENYNYDDVPWFSYRSLITSVIIRDGVTSIGDYAFSGCTGLTSVSIGNSVTSIGDYAFSGCTGLTSVEIPNSVTSIGGYAFYECSGLTSVEIPNSVTIIENFTFENCSNLISVTIPNSVTSIGGYAFSGCTGLTSVSIGNSVTSIGVRAFFKCNSLTSVTIPNSVTSIGVYAFGECSNLISVTIPNSVTSIGGYAFSGCTGLTSITIPSSVTSIENNTFENCSNLISVTIPNSVKSIGYKAFFGCTSLTSVTIPNNVTSIGNDAFYGCTGLTDVIWNATNCADFAEFEEAPLFEIRKNITTFTFGDNVENIPACLCAGMSNIDNIIIPASVTSIGSGAFANCSGLTSLNIPNSVISIGDLAFDGCTGLTSVEIPNSVTSIGYAAFAVCENLHTVTIPESVTTIGKGYTFAECTSLKKVYWNARDCELLSNDDNTVSPPFSEVQTIENFVFGENVEKIPNFLCMNAKLNSIVIPNKVLSIGKQAFCNCQLNNLVLGTRMKEIGNYAFYGNSLDTITSYAKRVPTVGTQAFDGTSTSTCILYVLADYMNAYETDNFWGDFIDIRPIGAKSSSDGNNVTPTYDGAEMSWTDIPGAATYDVIIYDQDGNVKFIFTFDANTGRLIGFRGAPARYNQEAQDLSSGYSFTITSLQSGTTYTYEIKAVDSNEQILDVIEGSFTTLGGESAEGVEDIEIVSRSIKLLRDGQILILRGDKTYTLTGQEVK